MEVRKEFMPGIVQNYNKSKQVTATGQLSKVIIFKGKLNPMHLSVQKDYLKDKGLAFDEQRWAVEHFLLNDPKVQQQLFKSLILPAKDVEKKGMPSNANQGQRCPFFCCPPTCCPSVCRAFHAHIVGLQGLQQGFGDMLHTAFDDVPLQLSLPAAWRACFAG
ncbi:TPA: hypothetical protein ACH3X1_013367 [Trebouxia sp. C0004]